MTLTSPPTWSTSYLYSGLDDPVFLADFERLCLYGEQLADVLDRRDVRGGPPRACNEADVITAEEVVTMLNVSGDLGRTLWAFIEAHARVDSSDDTAMSFAARLGAVIGRSRGLNTRFAAWLAALDVDTLADGSALIDDHRGVLARLALRAQHQMSEAEESLYAEVSSTGSMAWARLHGQVSGQLDVDVLLPEGVTRMSVAQARGLASHADPDVRHAAFEAEMTGWPTVAKACAAALNGIKGEAAIVNRRRGWSSTLDASLFMNNVERSAYDAMTAAIVESLPDFQRFLRAKARRHGHPGGLPWWDMMAPLPGAARTRSWSDGIAQIRATFGTYSGPLQALVDRAVDEQWIDALARTGKGPGASCIPVKGDRSLVILNWNGAMDQVFTTAHELGHAYHNTQLARRPAMQRDVPMALAETASIFCETLMVNTALDGADDDERLAILDLDLCSASQTVSDIHSRVLFETSVFERRPRGPLSVDELCELMTQAQVAAFGDAVRADTLHPYMWAVKQHYYSSHYYNWQYTFGHLYGLGLYARYRADADSFRAEYDDMLSRAGRDTAAQLAARFGIELSDPTFWRSSLDVLRDRIRQYESLSAD
jgi:pepF/M3 family oligoendopeptidase